MIQFLTWSFNPFTIAIILLSICGYAVFRNQKSGAAHKRTHRILVVFTGCWILLWSQPLAVNRIGLWLEEPYPYVAAERQPECSAIVLLGGGMGAPRRAGDVPEMFGAADRVWHAARLWRAGKAKIIIATGSAEQESSYVLLRDLGVPASAIIVEEKAGNTIENGIYVRQLIDKKKLDRRILLVTSAWHMRRSEMIFRRVGLEPIPAASDHEATYGSWRSRKIKGLRFSDFLPNANAFSVGCIYVKECQGLLGDWLRLKIRLRDKTLEE